MGACVQVAGPGLSSEQRRLVYPNLQKRLDDSNDEIRIRAASCCRAFFASLTREGYDDANSEYFTTAVVVHMDDADPRVQVHPPQGGCQRQESFVPSGSVWSRQLREGCVGERGN
jgi:hypothetical protein